jgi:hypothetical protein
LMKPPNAQTEPPPPASKRLDEPRRVFATVDLSDDEIKAIADARMDPRHNHLDILLGPK